MNVKGHERTGPPDPQPIEGALDRLAPVAEEAAKQAGFSKSSAHARGFEMWSAARPGGSGTDEAVAVYHWPRGVVRIGVQTHHVEVERLP
jgi:hypothetical protein